jgi:nitroreductase
VRAPSSHNTQPWRFRVRDTGIELLADRTRALPINDPDHRELTISCGAALLNLRVAALAAGAACDTHLLPDAAEPDLLARVTLSASSRSTSGGGLAAEVARRRTVREPFAAAALSSDAVAALAEAAGQEGAWWVVLAEEAQRLEAADLVAAGNAAQWADPAWRAELAAWIHTYRQGDGLAVPPLVAPIARFTVRTFDLGKRVGATDRALVTSSPLLAVLGTDGDTLKDWLDAGQALQRVLLTASGRGLQASYLNQPVQVPALRPRLQRLAAHPGYPQMLLRLGVPRREPPPSPRRHLDDVILD